jgi:hypothetical protein
MPPPPPPPSPRRRSAPDWACRATTTYRHVHAGITKGSGSKIRTAGVGIHHGVSGADVDADFHAFF